MCRAQLWDLSAQGIVPVFLEKVGRWWDAKDGEIDIVGLSEADNAIVFGECKFKRTGTVNNLAQIPAGDRQPSA